MYIQSVPEGVPSAASKRTEDPFPGLARIAARSRDGVVTGHALNAFLQGPLARSDPPAEVGAAH